MPKTYQIHLELGQFNGNVKLHDGEALESWHQEQKETWQWIQAATSNNTPITELWRHISAQWQEIDRAINQWKSVDEAKKQGALETVLSVIKRCYSQNRLLRANTPRGILVKETSESDPILAANILRYFVGLGIAPNDYRALEGGFVALQFDKGIKSNIDEERASLNSLKAEWELNLSSLEDSFNEIQARGAEQGARLDEQSKSNQDEFDQFLAEAKESKENIEKTYRENMALRAPVRYWSDKATRHHRLSKFFGVAAGISGGVVAGSLGLLAYGLLLTIDKPDYWRLAVLGIFTTLGVWFVRILVRLFLSNLHQGSDAEERVTMVQTFLALMSEGHINQESDRHLVLQSLFRGTSTGLIKDEAAPPTIIDITNKMAGKN